MKEFIAPMIVVLTSAVAASATAGGNSHDSMLPRNTDDEGTPFAVIVITVDRELAVKSKVSTN